MVGYSAHDVRHGQFLSRFYCNYSCTVSHILIEVRPINKIYEMIDLSHWMVYSTLDGFFLWDSRSFFCSMFPGLFNLPAREVLIWFMLSFSLENL